jgi:hypothetical protein
MVTAGSTTPEISRHPGYLLTTQENQATTDLVAY